MPMIRLIIICILLHFFVQSFVFKQRSVQVPHKLFSSPYGSVLLKCEGISKSYTGGITQFADISIDVAAGQRIGLIGINGCGKSTLLRCMAGVESIDRGKIEKATKCNIVYIEQNPLWDSKKVIEAIFDGDDPKALASRRYLCAAHSNDMVALELFTNEMQNLEAWEFQEQALSIANSLQIPESLLHRSMSSLSGGQKRRISLASALLKSPDMLLLDEPTNHLDMYALEWLANFLTCGFTSSSSSSSTSSTSSSDPSIGAGMTMCVVSHDRYFLDKVCTEMIELDAGSIHRYTGNYAKFVVAKEARLLELQSEMSKTKALLGKEKEWMSRQPQARQAKSKARQSAFYELADKSKELSSKVATTSLNLDVDGSLDKRGGKVVIELKDVTYKMAIFNKYLLQNVSFQFNHGDRVGIVGRNGVGKSTFLKIIMSLDHPIHSGSIKVGQTIRFGYCDQKGLNITSEESAMTLLEFVKWECRHVAPEKSNDLPHSIKVSEDIAVDEYKAMKLLQQFQFPRSRWSDRVVALSGGEKKRLQLLQMLLTQPNFLILDEPSNDLDIITLTVLEDYINSQFDGTLLVVSHDRYFMDKVVDQLLVFEGDGLVKRFNGDYSDYLLSLKNRVDNTISADI